MTLGWETIIMKVVDFKKFWNFVIVYLLIWIPFRPEKNYIYTRFSTKCVESKQIMDLKENVVQWYRRIHARARSWVRILQVAYSMWILHAEWVLPKVKMGVLNIGFAKCLLAHDRRFVECPIENTRERCCRYKFVMCGLASATLGNALPRVFGALPSIFATRQTHKIR